MLGISFAAALAALVVGKVASEDNEAEALCGRYETYTKWPYMINNNAWNRDDSGSICTYICSSCSGIAFHSLWDWTSTPARVHAYPNVEVKSDLLPLRLGSLAALHVSASWAFAPASLPAGASHDPNTGPDASAITANRVQANVVLDVFADVDAERSQTPSKQMYELMVWVGVFGDAAWPIGMNTPRHPPVVVRLEDIDFTLYNGTNANNQSVYSWVTNQTLPTFALDFAPLFGYLCQEEGIPAEVFLGVVQFGSETFYAESRMNFSVDSYEARIETTTPDAAGTGVTTATLPVATAVSRGVARRGSVVAVVVSSLGVVLLSFVLGCVMFF